jgi:hypothetical protein
MIGLAYTGYHLVQTQQRLGTMQSELDTVKRDAEWAKAQATEFASLLANLNSELEKANAQRAPENLTPSNLIVPSAAYVVRDAAGNCAVVDFQPSAGSDLKIVERGDYAECKDVIDRKDLIGEVEQSRLR